MQLMKSTRTIVIMGCAMMGLQGCGGGGGDDSAAPSETASTATGVFKDSNVSGLSYVSGDQSGVTAADGSFEYVEGENITFSVGNVVIGSAEGGAVVTPVDLVSGADTGSLEVQNIVRFLMMLDVDGNPDNGIEITSAVQQASENWSQIDFSTNDLASELSSIISDAASVDGTPHVLPSAGSAQNHLEATLLCTRSGAFKGTFQGGDNGPFGFMLDAETGFVIGFAYSNNMTSTVTLSGNTSVSLDSSGVFTSGDASSGATFEGQFADSDNISGTWENTIFGISGTFSGSRISGDISSAYRFTGTYSGSDVGLYAFDVSDSGNITGVAYSVFWDQLYDLSGNLNGTSLSATSSDGAQISGTLDTSTGLLTGSWVNSSEGTSGSFSGHGCQLN